MEACFDRTETTGAVWLGLTVGCARCHSHKYDAISQREYYQLFAFFNNADEQSVVVPKSESEIQSYQKEKEGHDLKVVAAVAELRKVQEELASTWLQLEEKLQATLAEDRDHPVVRNAWSMTSAHCDQPGVSIESKKGNQLFVSGESPDKAVYDLFGRQAGATFQTLRLETLPEKIVPRQRSRKIQEWQLRHQRSRDRDFGDRGFQGVTVTCLRVGQSRSRTAFGQTLCGSSGH